MTPGRWGSLLRFINKIISEMTQREEALRTGNSFKRKTPGQANRKPHSCPEGRRKTVKKKNTARLLEMRQNGGPLPGVRHQVRRGAWKINAEA